MTFAQIFGSRIERLAIRTAKRVRYEMRLKSRSGSGLAERFGYRPWPLNASASVGTDRAQRFIVVERDLAVMTIVFDRDGLP